MVGSGGKSFKTALTFAASVQELIMVAIVSLLARKPESSSHVIERLRIVAQQSSKYIRKAGLILA